MKTQIHALIVCLLLVLNASEAAAQWGNKKVEGNGNVTTKTRNTQEYDAIKVVGSMAVHLESGSEGTISVTTDDNLHEFIIVEITEENTLVIRTEKSVSLRTKKGIRVTVPFQDISLIELVGSGDIKTKDPIRSTALELAVIGSGDVILDVDTENLDAKVTGSGDMVLAGRTTNLELKLSGSGDFKGMDLEALNTEAFVSGSGDAKVTANNSLKARVNGSGDIRYSGNPSKSDTKVSGSGSIKSM
ncbi:head GIN domain-containing protein [Altibacter sp.]|uniref:head GIN domain-containing protein n=1 Tax=Altibacter sp. TaxID=2024823 RepID=UPI000C94A69E|nr:head GIN domain-containing protein [Altibacter sp.]MAP54211.1 DUF2807 domain-containing protein [Altibacter sp.]